MVCIMRFGWTVAVACLLPSCTFHSPSDDTSAAGKTTGPAFDHPDGAMVRPTSPQGAGRGEASAVDERSTYELANAVRAARFNRGPGAWGKLTADWTGRRFRWTVGYRRALCRRAESCAVLPFDHRRIDARAQGWMPTLMLSAAGHRRLAELCSTIPRCVVDVEGELALEVGEGLPPHVVLRDVEVLRGRAASPDESWVRRPPVARAAPPRPR